MHMDVQALAISAVSTWSLGLPVSLHQLDEPAVLRVDHMFADRPVGPFGRFPPERITRGQEVLAEGVDPEAMPIADLGGVGRLPLAVGDPVPTAKLLVPVVVHDEPGTHLGELAAPAAPVAGSMGARHGEEHPDLHEKGLFGLSRGFPVPAKMSEKTSMRRVRGTLDPKRKERLGQVGASFLKNLCEFVRRRHRSLLQGTLGLAGSLFSSRSMGGCSQAAE